MKTKTRQQHHIIGLVRQNCNFSKNEQEIELRLPRSIKDECDRNAREELLQKIVKENVLAAEITINISKNGCLDLRTYELQTGFFSDMIDDKKVLVNYGVVKLELKPGYTDYDWHSFLQALDFMYDAYCGTQYISGIVWNKDNTWLERVEYDGRENWRLRTYPKLPWVHDEKTNTLDVTGEFRIQI